jgi:phosphoadenosine phosphosulfate reductase
MPLEASSLPALSEQYAQRHPSEILAFAFEQYSPNIGISFSGAEDVVLVDMAAKLGAKFRVFSLDTARLHAETMRFLEKVREKYNLPIEIFFPKPEAVQKLVVEKGFFSFYKDGHQ